MSTNTTPNRDPHLPPPEVCDWLLERQWSARIPSIEMEFPEGGAFGCLRSSLNGYHEAHAAIGRDETARLFMPDDALEVLRKDQDDRRAALEQKRHACEADEMARKARREQQRPCEAEADLGAINIVFDAPPGPEGPRFIEVETDDGRSISVGEWQQRLDGNWALRIAALPRVPRDPDVDPETDLLQRILQECKNTELSAVHAVGVLHSAALLMGSNTFPLMDPKTFSLINSEQEGE